MSIRKMQPLVKAERKKIREVLLSCGVKIRSKKGTRTSWTPERISEAAELYASGMMLVDVYKAMGRTGKTAATEMGKILKEAGVPIRQKASFGKETAHPRWNGGTSKTRGYVKQLVPDHPFARNGYVLQHRLVMEKMLGRLLTAEEVVHHKNGIKDDNRPENLQLFPNNAAHLQFHRENPPQ